MFTLVNRGVGPVLTQGHHMNKVGRGPLENATYQISKLYALYFSFREEDLQIFYFFPFGCHGNQSLPELRVEFNLLNNFGRASPKEHPCKVSSRLAK